MGATARLAEFVVKSRWEETPAAAIEQGKRAILDTTGVMLAGSVEPAARIVRGLAEAEGGAPRCAMVGTAMRTGAGWAALANGTAAHALDFDDTNFAMMGHPSAPVLPAALAAGELCGGDGRALIHAYLVGFEVEAALGETLNPAHYEHGWHATGTLGSLGAAAAASRMLGLDAEKTRTALALAASQASGLKENFGTMAKPFHAGHAARTGVLSALLARDGFTASEQAIEGPQGFLKVLGGSQNMAALEAFGAPWKILSTGIAVKPYPCCAMTHSAIDAVLELRSRHGVQPEDVATIEVGVAPVVPGILIHPKPQSGLEAKFSMEYCAAAALAEGRVGIGAFGDDRLRDGRVRSLMEKVRMSVDPSLGGRQEQNARARVTLHLADGRRLVREPQGPQGHPDRPLSHEQLLAKFRDCARAVLPAERVDAAAEAISTLERCPKLAQLTALLS
jgi:2-methylcitrate dehydratase PrpD